MFLKKPRKPKVWKCMECLIVWMGFPNFCYRVIAPRYGFIGFADTKSQAMSLCVDWFNAENGKSQL